MIQTKRLMLRQWQDSDSIPFAAMNADPEVMACFPALLNQMESDAALARYRQAINENDWGFWAAERRDTGDFIGFVGLNIPNYPLPFAPCVEIGWRLCRSAWHQGFASEAAQAALEYGFTVLRLPEIVSFTSEHNRRSEAVMQRIGMIRDQQGDFLHPKLHSEHWLAPHRLYRLGIQQWRQPIRAQ